MKQISIDKIENIEQVKALLYLLTHAIAGRKLGEKAKIDVADSLFEVYPALNDLVVDESTPT